LHGAISYSWMEHDNDLAAIREEPRFQTLLENYSKQTTKDKPNDPIAAG
jgi:hypothetical protein